MWSGFPELLVFPELRGERVSKQVRTHVLSNPCAVGYRICVVLDKLCLGQDHLLQREVVLSECPYAVGHRHDADVGVRPSFEQKVGRSHACHSLFARLLWIVRRSQLASGNEF
jgi:hypothetical protein